MEDSSRKDIRRILKTFGIKADEAMSAHLARNPLVDKLQVRITLTDLSDYNDTLPDSPLEVVVEDEIRRE
ncbi:MAG: hypothetical protein ACWGPS_09000 [Candidatus Promineifilaceae bacterium]